jgi:hypothetical protein
MFKFNLFTWVTDLVDYFTFYGGGKGKGGGSAQPTQSTNYTTNIPEYARPYVENMLNATQAQIYTDDMKGFNKYVPYSSDPTKYVAGFSPLQSYAQSGAAGLSLPANYGLATGQTLGTGMQMGALAPQLGMAGANYASMATNPYATSAYMNPYLSASLAPQLAEARRQYDITGAQQQSAATRAGGFGGSREALMAAENRRNMGTAMNQMLGQGYNQAFNQAQQAQQFGANLGLQGQQAQLGALQGQLGAANQLAGIGGQQLQAQQGIFNLQNQLGGQQQAQQQNIINQAIQNYATEQQYPFMQLGVLNSMLRGLPMQQSSTQMYQAPPSAVSQLAGLGTAGLGALGMYNQATGNKSGGLMEVKKMASGGSALPMKSYSDPQLQNVIKSPASSMMADIYAQSLLKDRAYLKSNPMAANLINQQQMPQSQQIQQMPQGTPPGMPQTSPLPSPDQMAMAPQSRIGLDSIGTGEMTQMAGGGILAFAKDGSVPEVDDEVATSKFGDLMRSIYEKTVTPARTSTPELDIDAQISELAQERAKYGINPFKAVKESERSSKESKQKEYTDKIDSLREMKRNLGNTSKAPTTIPGSNILGSTQSQGTDVPASYDYNDPTQALIGDRPIPSIVSKAKEAPAVKADTETVKTNKKGAPSVSTKEEPDDLSKMIKELYNTATVKDATKDEISQIKADMAARKKAMGSEALTRFGLGMMSGSSPYALTNIGKAGSEALDYMGKQMGLNQADTKLLLEQAVEAQKADEARRLGLAGVLQTAKTAKENKELTMLGINAQLAETRQQKEDANRALYTKLYADYKKDFATQLYRANKDRTQELTDDQIDELASQSAIKALASSPDAAKYLGLATAAPKALPMPANPSAKNLISGQVYMTNKGAATWDGKQFIQ